VAAQLRVPEERLVLHLARRWDRLRDRLRTAGFGGVVAASEAARVLNAPQLGAQLRLRAGLALRANGSRGERAPDFLELFGNQGSVRGNPSLRPERVESWDGGATWSAAVGPWRASTTWAHFQSRFEDLIVYVGGRGSVRAENVARARIRGEELGLQLAARGFALTGSFTWQTAVDASDAPSYTGKQLPQRPAREGHAQLSCGRGPLGLAAHVHYLGDNALDRYNRYTVASRTLCGASLSLAPSRWPLRVIVEGKNLADREAADVAGFPLPGRSVFVSCETWLAAVER